MDTKGIKVYPVVNEIGGNPEIIHLGNKLGVDYNYCWTCYSKAKWIDGVPHQCGICSDCSTRYSAFKKAGMIAPLPYIIKPKLKGIWYGA